MSETIRELIARLGVEVDPKGLDAFNDGLSAAKGLMVAGVAAAVGFTAALFGLAQSAAKVGDEAAKGGVRIGETAETYQELSYAAERSGTDMATLETALRRQTSALDELESGSGKAGEALAELGIEARTSDGELKSNSQILEEVAGALSGVTDEQERLQIAQDIYGSKLGGKLMPLLDDGADGIAALRDEARALGLVMSDEAAADAEAFQDAVLNLTGIVSGLKNQIGAALMPVITELIGDIQGWYLANREVINSGIQDFAQRLVDVVRIAAEWIAYLIDVVGGWENALLGIVSVVGLVVGGSALGALISALVSIGGAISAVVGFISSVGIPILAVAAGALASLAAWFAVVSLVIEDLIVWFQGGESAIGMFLARFEGAQSLLTSLGSLVAALQNAFVALYPVIAFVAEIWWFVFSHTTLALLGALAGIVLWLADGAFGALAVQIQFVADLISWISQLVNNFGSIVDSVISGVMSQIAGVGSAISGVAGMIGLDVSGSLAPTSAPSDGGTTSNQVAVGGTVNNIDASGWSEEQLASALADYEAQKNRSALDTLDGSEV